MAQNLVTFIFNCVWQPCGTECYELTDRLTVAQQMETFHRLCQEIGSNFTVVLRSADNVAEVYKYFRGPQ